MAESSRVCVKGLPKHLTEQRMRSLFEEAGQITDVKIVRTAEGKSRLFGFVGFATAEEAAKAVARMDKTFIDTSRIGVELARGVGDAALARPWSKYSEGSSRFQGKGEAGGKPDHAEKKTKRAREAMSADEKERERDEKFEQFLKLAMPGKTQEKKAMPWENAAEEENEKTNARVQEEQQGEEVDDLAWLRAKQGLEAPEGEEKKGKKKKRDEVEADEPDEDAYLRTSVAVRQAETTAKIAETRRLFIRNLPGNIEESELRVHCGRFGTVTDCVMPLADKTKLPKGFALVTFGAPHEALQAYAGLDGQILGGKLLHVVAAEAPRGGGGGSEGAMEKGTSSFKKQRDLQKKNEGQQHAGNVLYVKADTAAALTAEKLGLKKAELLSAEAGGSMAVRAALAEAEVIADVKRFLEEHGVVPEVLANADKSSAEKSDSVFLVKNLPAGTASEKLEQLYAPFGDLGRVLVVPGGSLGLVEFQRPSEAQKAYRRTAFSNFAGAPLYLQWAPVKLFSSAFEFKERAASAATHLEPAVEEAEGGAEGDEGVCSVFVKNLSFSTTREELAAHVGTEGVRAVTIVTKNGQSLGYGFVEFASKAAAVKAMKQLQGFKLDGHVLELMFSSKQEPKKGAKKSKKKKTQKKEAEESNKLVVRNVPFEASKKELQQLLGAYGALKSLRLPLKFDRSHRGYAFAEFQSKSEARKALEALESAHLYGRHLVVEYARAEDEVADVREKTAKKFKPESK